METNRLSALWRAIGMTTLAALASFGLAMAQGDPAPVEPQRADRWVIQFDHGAFSLLSRSETTKILPASDELPAVQLPPSGFWFELLGADGSLRYRRIVGDPVRLVFEGPSEPDVMPASATGPGKRGGLITPRGTKPDDRWQAERTGKAYAPPMRDEAVPDQRVFSLLTPAASQGDTLVLFSSPLEPNSQAEPATEVARFTVEPNIPQR